MDRSHNVEDFVDRFLAAPPESQGELVAELEGATGVPRDMLRQHLLGEASRDYLIERIQLFEPGNLARSDEQLFEIIRHIVAGDGSAAQTDEWLRVLSANTSAPRSYISDLIFYPETEPVVEADVLRSARAYASPSAIPLPENRDPG
jgi:hypothetical protein